MLLKRQRFAVSVLASLLMAGTLGACAMSDNESFSALMVSPGKFQYYRCPELEKEGTERARRAKELKDLMDRSARGPGGGVANALAYRNEYLTAVGELRQMEQVAVEKKCETPWRSVSEQSMW